jgi:prophage antirepressor-like protein
MNAIVPHNDDGFQTFDFNGIPVRAKLDDSGDPIILASPICDALNLADVSKALAGLPADEKGKSEVLTPGGWQKVWHVTEGGLYRLIFRSNKPEAEEFRKKVFNEILPAVRKSHALTPAEIILAQAQQLVKVERQIAALTQMQAQHAIGLEAVNERITDSEYFTVRQWCQLQRMSSIKYTVMQQWGKRAAALSREREIEIRRVNEGENNVGSYHKSILMEVCVIKPKTDPDQLRLGA